MNEAAASLGETSRRVFLTIGRLEVAAFAAAPQHRYLVRTIEPIGDALPVPHVTVMLGARARSTRKPSWHCCGSTRIEIVVSKNSGGPATYGKIAAARRLGLPVVMVVPARRPRRSLR